MVEIRCDSATLHVYTGPTALSTDPQLGERQFFKGRERVALPFPGDRTMHVYAWLWKDDAPYFPADPVWLQPGDTYNPSPIVIMSYVDPDPDPLLQLLAHETGSQGDED